MNTPVTINSEAPKPAQDYNFLRAEGIRYLELLAGKIWTDFNTHDPGVTILEQLCYALTDLGYRIEYNIQDLLASADPSENPYADLYAPVQILSSPPVHLKDYRKLLLDINGLRNAWVNLVDLPEAPLQYNQQEEQLLFNIGDNNPDMTDVKLKGLYQVVLQPEEGEPEEELIQKVKDQWMSNRSIGEDLDSIEILQEEVITVVATVEVEDQINVEEVLANIYYTLDQFISPSITFYSLTAMLAKGYRMDEIMDGPFLQSGFIDAAEMEQFDKKTYLRSSDLIRLMMNLSGVRLVKSILLQSDSDAGSFTENWSLDLQTNCYPSLNTDFSNTEVDLSIQLVKEDLTIIPDRTKLETAYQDLLKSGEQKPIDPNGMDSMPPEGKYRNIEQYFSIQNQFPELFGIGQRGLPENATPQRRAEAKQLKAYLLFFDQLLANYFAQLAHAKDLFNFSDQVPSTYFYQYPGRSDYNGSAVAVNDLFVNGETGLTDFLSENTTDSETSADRQNRLYNHLLARFSEQFTDYSLLMYNMKDNYNSDELQNKLGLDKQTFLKEYLAISNQRNQGFNYLVPSWDTNNISGLERRIGRLLGIEDLQRRSLSTGEEEGFYLVEHLLLRPTTEDLPPPPGPADPQDDDFFVDKSSPELLNNTGQQDPFSLQLSFIFPDWTGRFTDEMFRNFVEQTILKESPVHLRVNIRWVNQTDMAIFEDAYKDWLDQLATTSDKTSVKVRAARDRLIDVLSGLPTGAGQSEQAAFGQTFPIRNLPVAVEQENIVIGETANVQISDSQSDVSYKLVNYTTSDEYPEVNGNGGLLSIVTNPLTTARQYFFRIQATKVMTPNNSFWLEQELSVDVSAL